MSYSFQLLGPYSLPADQKQLVADLEAQLAAHPGDDDVDAVRDHLIGASAAAVSLAEHVGAGKTAVLVSVSGHAEPGHVQQVGRMQDQCYVSVAAYVPAEQLAVPAAAAEPFRAIPALAVT